MAHQAVPMFVGKMMEEAEALLAKDVTEKRLCDDVVFVTMRQVEEQEAEKASEADAKWAEAHAEAVAVDVSEALLVGTELTEAARWASTYRGSEAAWESAEPRMRWELEQQWAEAWESWTRLHEAEAEQHAREVSERDARCVAERRWAAEEKRMAREGLKWHQQGEYPNYHWEQVPKTRNDFVNDALHLASQWKLDDAGAWLSQKRTEAQEKAERHKLDRWWDEAQEAHAVADVRRQWGLAAVQAFEEEARRESRASARHMARLAERQEATEAARLRWATSAAMEQWYVEDFVRRTLAEDEANRRKLRQGRGLRGSGAASSSGR